MEYQKLETKSGTVIIKDAEESELKDFISIYKSVFKKHNIFQKTDEEIFAYLKESNEKNSSIGGGYIVAKLRDKTIGGILVRKKGEDLERKHVLWIYNHVAVSSDYPGLGIGTNLMNAAEQKIKGLIKEGKIKTAKVELGVSENEKKALDFFKKHDFEIEGKSKSHYRFNELVYVLGKEITS